MYRNEWLPEVFNDFFSSDKMVKPNGTAPAINVLESDADYVVELAAPGMRKEDFDININADGDLTIRMENSHQQDGGQVHYLRREFSYTKYEQALILPDDVDRDKIAASVADGVLTVKLPKLHQEPQKVARSIIIG